MIHMLTDVVCFSLQQYELF